MGIIKRLIVLEWFKIFFAAAFILFLILSVGNLLGGMMRTNVTTQEVFLNYLIELPGFITQVLPISCLVASLFSINKLKNRNELTAIFAGGFSRRQFVTTIIFCSFFVGGLQFFVSGYVVPFSKRYREFLIPDGDEKFRNLKGKGLKTSTIRGGRGNIWYKSLNYYFAFSTIDKQANTLNNLSIYFFNDNYKVTKQIDAEKAIYRSKNIWDLKNATTIDLLETADFPREIFAETVAVSLDETPDDFKRIDSDITTLNVFELGSYVARLKRSGINAAEYEVDYLQTYANAFICIILAVVASTSLFNPGRRNSSFGKSSIFVFVFTLFYWLGNSYFQEIGKNAKIEAHIAIFVIPLAFTLFLTYFFFFNRKLR